MNPDSGNGHDRQHEEPPDSRDGGRERAPSETHREAAYLRLLAQTQAPVFVKLRTGETVFGFIEYYDKRFIRLTRDDGPNLFIFKRDIKYLYEAAPPGERAEDHA